MVGDKRARHDHDKQFGTGKHTGLQKIFSVTDQQLRGRTLYRGGTDRRSLRMDILRTAFYGLSWWVCNHF